MAYTILTLAVDISPGARIDGAARETIALAQQLEMAVRWTFNGISMLTVSESTVEGLVSSYQARYYSAQSVPSQ